MNSFKRFHTATTSEEGIRLPISNPDGSDSAEWLWIRGQDSKGVQDALSTYRQEIQKQLAVKGLKWRDTDEYKVWNDAQIESLQAAAVKSWSFDEPCTLANVVQLFREAPYIQQEVLVASGKRQNFVTKSPDSSQVSPSESSS